MRTGWGPELARALAPAPAPWAVVPALRAVGVALVVLVPGLLLHDAPVAGVAYLGVVCAALFAGAGEYRVRVARVAGQAVGAAVGLTVGSLVPDTPAWVIAAAVVVAGVAGAVGTVGPAATACAAMAVIGTAYSQFGRLPLTWWQASGAYVAGSALLLAAALVGALVHPQRHRRAAVAAVFDGAAALLRAVGTAGADEARHQLALASATARESVVGLRFGPLARDPAGPAWVRAQQAAARAAHTAVAPDLTAAARAELAVEWEDDATAVRNGSEAFPADAVGTLPSRRRRARAAVRRATRRDALLQGVRSAACLGVATGLAVLLHPPQHAYWIPLTVAMVLRPEYGSVLARSVHRVVGTLGGAVAVAVLVEITRGPVALVVAAACALGLAVLASGRLYGLAVVGITGSALLSVALSGTQDIQPWARILDTVLGCAVAVVVGLLAWPARGLPDPRRALAATAATLAAHVTAELAPTTADDVGSAARDESYRQAHAWRAELERALPDPDPARAAAAWLPVALALERTVDAVAAAGDRVAQGAEPPPDVPALLDGLAGVGAASTPGEALTRIDGLGEALRSRSTGVGTEWEDDGPASSSTPLSPGSTTETST